MPRYGHRLWLIKRSKNRMQKIDIKQTYQSCLISCLDQSCSHDMLHTQENIDRRPWHNQNCNCIQCAGDVVASGIAALKMGTRSAAISCHLQSDVGNKTAVRQSESAISLQMHANAPQLVIECEKIAMQCNQFRSFLFIQHQIPTAVALRCCIL